MPVTMEEVRAHLDKDEPNYKAAAAALGAEALPLLLKLVTGADSMLASKAAFLAAVIRQPESVEVVAAAASSSDPIVRVAAAAAVKRVPELISGELGSDEESGARTKAARRTRAARADEGASLRAKLEEMARSDDDEGIRKMSQQALEQAGRTSTDRRAAPAATREGEGFGGGSFGSGQAGAPESVAGRASTAEREGQGFGGGSFSEGRAAAPAEAEGTGYGGGDFGRASNIGQNDGSGFGGGDTGRGASGNDEPEGFGGGSV